MSPIHPKHLPSVSFYPKFIIRTPFANNNHAVAQTIRFILQSAC